MLASQEKETVNLSCWKHLFIQLLSWHEFEGRGNIVNEHFLQKFGTMHAQQFNGERQLNKVRCLSDIVDFL